MVCLEACCKSLRTTAHVELIMRVVVTSSCGGGGIYRTRFGGPLVWLCQSPQSRIDICA